MALETPNARALRAEQKKSAELQTSIDRMKKTAVDHMQPPMKLLDAVLALRLCDQLLRWQKADQSTDKDCLEYRAFSAVQKALTLPSVADAKPEPEQTVIHGAAAGGGKVQAMIEAEAAKWQKALESETAKQKATIDELNALIVARDAACCALEAENQEARQLLLIASKVPIVDPASISDADKARIQAVIEGKGSVSYIKDAARLDHLGREIPKDTTIANLETLGNGDVRAGVDAMANEDTVADTAPKSIKVGEKEAKAAFDKDRAAARASAQTT